MIIYSCDLCKTEEINDSLRLSIDIYTRDTVIVWDICSACVPKLEETLGTGRKFVGPAKAHKK